MAILVLPSLTRTPGAQDDYPFFILNPDGTKRDITNDLVEVVVGDTISGAIFSANSNDPTKVEKDAPTIGGVTIHLSPDFLPAVTGSTTRYQVRVTPNATAPGADSVVVGEGEFTIKTPLFLLPTFSIAPASPSVSIVAGGNNVQNVDVNSQNFFAGTVALSAAVSPVVVDGPGVSVTTPAVVPSGGTATKSLAISTVAATPLGSYTVTITGTVGGLVVIATVDLTVT